MGTLLQSKKEERSSQKLYLQKVVNAAQMQKKYVILHIVQIVKQNWLEWQGRQTIIVQTIMGVQLKSLVEFSTLFLEKL